MSELEFWFLFSLIFFFGTAVLGMLIGSMVYEVKKNKMKEVLK